MRPTVDPTFDKEIPLKIKEKVNINYMAIPSIRTVDRSRKTKKYTTFENISKIVCEFFNVSLEQIKKKGGRKEVPKARHIIGYMSRVHTTLFLREIGEKIDRDHATIINSMKVCNDLMETDPSFHYDIIEIDRLIEAIKE